MANLRNASASWRPRLVLSLGLFAVVLAVAVGAAAGETSGDEPTDEARSEIPILEPGNEGPDDDGERVRQIKFGETVKLDDIGPIIVNEDCSMRRIANWGRLTQREKNGVQRRIASRNKGRLEKCRQLEDKGELPRPLDVYDDFGHSARDPASHIEEVSIASILVGDHEEL